MSHSPSDRISWRLYALIPALALGGWSAAADDPATARHVTAATARDVTPAPTASAVTAAPARDVTPVPTASAVTAAPARDVTPAPTQKQRGADASEERVPGPPDDSDEAASPDGATLMLAPSQIQTDSGDRLRVSLSILGADRLARLPVTIRFDAEVLSLISVTLGSAWHDRAAPLLLSDASRPGELVVGIAALDRLTEGIAGTAELLDLEFRALRTGESKIELDRFAVIGADGTSQAAAARGATIVIR